MKKSVFYISGIVLLLVFVMPAHSVAQTKDAQKLEGKELFEKKCSTCHKTDRSTSKKKTAKEWESTVTRMINSRGAQINDAEAKTIIDYLAANYGKPEKK